MENKCKKTPRALFVGGVAAVGLAACCMAAPAFAENTLQTDVTVQADPSSTQITWEAPTVIAFSADSAGNLTGPTNGAKIVNKSIFPIHVTEISAAKQGSFNLVLDASTASTENNVQFDLVTGTATVHAASGANVKVDANYDMGYAGSSSESIDINTANGKISKVTENLSTPQTVAKVSWTVEAGSHANA